MVRIIIASILGIAVALVINYFFFNEILFIPSFIGVLAFITAYTVFQKKKLTGDQK